MTQIDIEEAIANHPVTLCPTMRAKEWDEQDDDTAISIVVEGNELAALTKQVVNCGN